MTWWNLVHIPTGRLIALDDQEILPRSLDERVFQRATRPNFDVEMWDWVTQSWVPRPAKVFGNRFNDIFTDPDMVVILNRLNAAQQATLRTVIRRHRAVGTDIYNPAEPEKEPGI